MSKVVGRFWLKIFSALFVCTLACPVVAQDKKEITFGYSISLTGKFSTDATDTHKAYQMWAEDTNKAGGITVKDRKLPIKLVHYDDASDTNTAIRNYERLVTRDEVDFLLSPWGSGHNFAVTAATEKYKYPMVLSSAASDRIFDRNLKYIFGATQLASNFYELLGDYLATSKDQVKTVAIAYENFLFTQSLHDFLVKKLQSLGIQVVVDEQYPLGGQDFTSLLTKVKAANPDGYRPDRYHAFRRLHDPADGGGRLPAEALRRQHRSDVHPGVHHHARQERGERR